jgi:hypothetical protein
MRLEKPGVRGHRDIEYQIITHLKIGIAKIKIQINKS